MKGKKGKMSNEEIIARLYVNSLNNLQDSTLLITTFYDKQCTLILKELYDLKDNEPLKIFKHSHKQWEEDIQRLESKYKETFDKFISECSELERLNSLGKIND